MKIGGMLKHLRIASQHKQKDVAEKLNISPTYLSLIEKDERKPHLKLLEEYAAILNVPLPFLILQANDDRNNFTPTQRELFEQISKLLFEFQALRCTANNETA